MGVGQRSICERSIWGTHTIYNDGSAPGGTTASGAATVGDPADPVIIHTSKARGGELTSSYKEEKAALLLALDWIRANCPTERISICSDSQYLLKAVQSYAQAPSLFASDWTTGKAPPPSSGFHVARAYQATRPPTKRRKQLPPSPTRHPDPSHLPPQKHSSDAPSPIPRPTGPEQPWCTNNSPARQTALPPPTGQSPRHPPQQQQKQRQHPQ